MVSLRKEWLLERGLFALGGKRRPGRRNEFGSSPAVIIHCPVLHIAKVWSNEHLLEDPIIHEKHQTRPVSCRQHSDDEIEAVDDHEYDGHCSKDSDWQRESDVEKFSSNWALDIFKGYHAIVPFTELLEG